MIFDVFEMNYFNMYLNLLLILFNFVILNCNYMMVNELLWTHLYYVEILYLLDDKNYCCFVMIYDYLILLKYFLYIIFISYIFYQNMIIFLIMLLLFFFINLFTYILIWLIVFNMIIMILFYFYLMVMINYISIMIMFYNN